MKVCRLFLFMVVLFFTYVRHPSLLSSLLFSSFIRLRRYFYFVSLFVSCELNDIHNLFSSIEKVIFQLTLDLAPNFVYNTITQRFVRAPHCFTEPVLRISKPQPDPNSFGNKVRTMFSLSLSLSLTELLNFDLSFICCGLFSRHCFVFFHIAIWNNDFISLLSFKQ